MINFTRAFNLAWERTVVILFQPFDLGKWFAIGFSAFLAGFLSGGNGFNASYRQNTGSNSHWSYNYNYSSNFNHLNSSVSGALSNLQSGVVIFLAVMVFLIVLMLIFAFIWLGARGQFLFLDNVARNRGAIAWPWATYRREGNSLFWFYLLVKLLALIAALPFVVIGIFMAMPYFQHHRWPEGGDYAQFGILFFVWFIVFLPLTILLFLYREMGVALMFRHRISARAAFGETWKLLRQHPGPLFLFCLLRVALFLALAITSVILCCLTCCTEAIPYLGTVILLPALVYVKCFTLDCLAQLGPEYDIWSVDVPGAATLPSAGISPPLPPG